MIDVTIRMGLVFALTSFSWTLTARAEGPTFKSPVSPEDSLGLIRLADQRLKVEVVAAEPQIADPVAAQFDEDGRLWVVEMGDYPHGPAPGAEPQSRIKVLEDMDGDGRFETSTIFADKLLFATELQPWQGGVIVTLAGEVAYFKDTDGDGRADQRETWYTGFAQENSQLRANHPRLGLDGWVYVSNGLRGGTVVDARKKDAPRIALAGKDFRFHPRTFEYEAITGVGQFGLTFDDFGNRFICSNRNPLMHVVLEERFIARNPRYAPPAARHDVGRAGEESRIYALSRAWTTSNLHAGQFTAACGVLIFRGDRLPKDYYGNGLTCDPTGNLVHREITQPLGATFTYQPVESQVEFLASPDEWFRPVNLFNGPDGALYVVDMYRAVIEHPDFMPNELKKRPDLALGLDRGRIYRVVAKDTTPPERRQLSQASTTTLIELLAKQGWYADTAQRLLDERRDPMSLEALKQATKSLSAAGAVRALWLLQGMNELDDVLLSEALRSRDPRVKEQAIQIVDARGSKSKLHRDLITVCTEDDDARVRFWALLALAPATSEDDLMAIKQAALRGVDDVWTRRAVAIAVGEQAEQLVDIMLTELLTKTQNRAKPPSAATVELLRELIVLAANKIPDEQATELLATVLSLPDSHPWQPIQRSLLRAYAEPLARQGKNVRKLADKLPEASHKIRLERMFSAAATLLSDPQAVLEDRVEAIQLLAFDEHAADSLLNVALNRDASAQIQPAMRTQAIAALSRTAGPATWKTLLATWSHESAAFRRALLDAIFSRPDRLGMLLDEVAAGQIRPNEIETNYVNRLLKTGNNEIRQRAETLLASAIPADRQKVLADYQGVLKLKANPQHGREIFAKNCATCHRIGELGVNVAPDISDSRVKLPEQLLTDILQPNRAIDNNYLSYTVVTSDGLTRTGIIAAETATSVTLRQQEGKDATLARTEIDELRSNGISLMPEGLEKNIPPQEMADLISFIKNWRYLDGRTPVGDGGGEG